MTLTRLKTILLSLAAMLVLIFLVVKTRPAPAAPRDRWTGDLRLLKHLDSTLTEQVLESRFSLLTNYDPLVANTQQVESVAAGLPEELRAACPPGQSDPIRPPLRAYRDVLDQKLVMIEDFKSENALLKNSLDYFPVLAEGLMAQDAAAHHATGRGGRSLAADEDLLLHKVLASNADDDGDLVREIPGLIDSVARRRAEVPLDQRPDFDLLIGHGRLIFSQRQALDTLLAQMVTLPTAERSDDLAGAYQAERAQEERQAHTYNVALGLYCALLLAWVALVLAKLGRAARAVRQAHDRLETRVEERTAELAGVNAALEQDIAERKRVETALRENQERLRLALESGRLGMYQIDLATGEPTGVSDTCRSHFGLASGEETLTGDFFRSMHPADHDRVEEAFRRSIVSGADYKAEFRYIFPDGSIHWIRVHGSPSLSTADKPPCLIGVTQDITDQKRAEEILKRERDFSAAVVDTVGSLVVVFDRQGAVVRFNRACERLTGYSFEEVKGKTIRDLAFAPEEAMAAFRDLDPAQFPNSHTGGWVTKDLRRRLIAWSDTALLDSDGDVEYVISTGTDITESTQFESEREQALVEALERADRDPLTNLPNHRAFHNILHDEAARAEYHGESLAVAMMDLDNFKFFNDVYGHAVGDQVLRLVAARLRAICGPEDTAARFGGDEFALLLPGVGRTPATEIEAGLHSALGDLAFLPEGHQTAIPITISVGVALFRDTSRDRDEVLRQADARLLRTKTGGAAETEADLIRARMGHSLQSFSMLDALVTAVDNKDRYTRRHSEDVMTYSLEIARELGMDEAAQHTVAVAALIHDVGKIGVPDAILRKPGKLTEEEFRAIQQHPQMGAIMVQAVPGLEDTLDAVRHHHERWDGAGYPFGLRGEETPLIARLMAVADAFSAMTTDRPYRKGMDRAKSLSILASGAGTQWDPVCVAAFLRAQEPSLSELKAA